MAAPLFPLGRVVMTRGALNALVAAGQDPVELLDRHRFGGWGDVPPEDAAENQVSVWHGWRLMSSYPVGDGQVWIITEADRSSTCFLLPDEYRPSAIDGPRSPGLRSTAAEGGEGQTPPPPSATTQPPNVEGR